MTDGTPEPAAEVPPDAPGAGENAPDEAPSPEAIDLVPVPSRAERLEAERRTTHASWQHLRSAMVLFLLLLSTSVATLIYVRVTDDTSPRVDLAATVVDAVIVLVFCWSLRAELRALLRPPTVTGRQLLFALAVLLGFGVAIEAWFFALHHWFEDYLYLADYRAHGWPLWSAVVLIVLCPAVFEELAFRGYLMHQFAAALDRGEILLVQAVLFATAHCSVAVLPSHFVMGLGLGWLRQRSGSLLPGMLVHAAWNGWVLGAEALRSGP